ncbi:MAG: YjfB family protein [Wujia sp.]
MNISSVGNSNMFLSVSGTEQMNAIDTSLLKKSLDSAETSGAMMIKMMEQSVNPSVGGQFDMRV